MSMRLLDRMVCEEMSYEQNSKVWIRTEMGNWIVKKCMICWVCHTPLHGLHSFPQLRNRIRERRNRSICPKGLLSWRIMRGSKQAESLQKYFPTQSRKQLSENPLSLAGP